MHIFVHGFVDTVKSKVTELYFVTFVIETLNHTAYNSAQQCIDVFYNIY